MKIKIKNIYHYTDYRQYLKDYYRERKAKERRFSIQKLAEECKLTDKSSVYSVMSGNQNLSKLQAKRFAQGLGLNRWGVEYFEALVGFNQGRTLAKRNRYFERMNNVKKYGRGAKDANVLRLDQFEYFSKWYHNAIRSLLDIHKFKNNWLWLSRMLIPPISLGQAKRSVRLLVRLGLVVKGKDGCYRPKEKIVTSGPDIQNVALQNFHVTCTGLAAAAIGKQPRGQRNITGLTLGISQTGYNKIVDKTQTFQQEILQIAKDDKPATRVYQYNFHLFPLTKIKTRARK